jgi:hypothetical protein
MMQVLVGDAEVGGAGRKVLVDVPVLLGSVVSVLLGVVGALVVGGAVVGGGATVVLDDDGGGGGALPPVTVIVPVIDGWNRQWKLNVPAVVKVNENVLPGDRSGEFQSPSSLVALCTVPSVSPFVQVTLSPTAMVRLLGLNCTLRMLIA